LAFLFGLKGGNELIFPFLLLFCPTSIGDKPIYFYFIPGLGLAATEELEGALAPAARFEETNDIQLLSTKGFASLISSFSNYRSSILGIKSPIPLLFS
jgi:hypothetical protein